MSMPLTIHIGCSFITAQHKTRHEKKKRDIVCNKKISRFCTSKGQYKLSNYEREKDILHHLRPDQTIREHVFIQLSNNVLGTNVAVWKRERRTFQIILGLTRQSRLALGRSQACCCCSNLFLWNMSTAGWKYLTKEFIQMWAQLGENVLQLNMKSWIEL